MKRLAEILDASIVVVIIIYCLIALLCIGVDLASNPAHSGNELFFDVVADFGGAMLGAILLLLVLIPLALGAMLADRAAALRITGNRCVQCDYDFRGLPSGAVCPECGADACAESIQ